MHLTERAHLQAVAFGAQEFATSRGCPARRRVGYLAFLSRWRHAESDLPHHGIMPENSEIHLRSEQAQLTDGLLRVLRSRFTIRPH